MKYKNKTLIFFSVFILFCSIIVLFKCGGSSEQGNARTTFISGSIDFDKNLQGEPFHTLNPKNVYVQLVDENYAPYSTTHSLIYTITSDSNGNFTFCNIVEGIYYLNAWDTVSGFRAIYGPFDLFGENRHLPKLILRNARQIRAKIPDSLSSSMKTMYIKGTTLKETYIDQNSQTALVDSVPAGSITINCTILSSSDDLEDIAFANINSIDNTDTITVTYLNSPPVINKPFHMMQNVFSYNEIYQDTIKASDPDNDSLIFSIINAPPEFDVSSDGKIYWTPLWDTVKSYSIGVKISDTKGASVNLWWSVGLTDTTDESPTPQPPVILSTGDIFNPGIFKATSPCVSSSPLFRFSFSDGDTTDWSLDSIASHVWNSYTPNPYWVTYQVKCNDLLTSQWSSQIEVVLKSDSSIVPPKPSIGHDSIIYLEDSFLDTFLISGLYKPCNNTLYQFSCNDTILSEWSADSILFFTPRNTGLHEIRVAVLCLEKDTLISPFSESLNLYVRSDTSIDLTIPPPVKPKGDSIISYNDSILFNYLINDSNPCSGGILPFYRFEFSGLSDAILEIDTTHFTTNTSVSFVRYNPSGIYTVRVQQMCYDSTYSTQHNSEWSDFFTTRIKPESDYED